jgi:transcriptional regulator with XRE-family HTH domain
MDHWKTMSENVETLNRLSFPADERWVQDAKFAHDNLSWLVKMGKIVMRIRQIIKQKGMSQKQLTNIMGVAPQRISVILKGKENLSFETLCQLDDIFNLGLFNTIQPKQPDYDEKSQVAVYRISCSITDDYVVDYNSQFHEKESSFFTA